MSAVALLVFFGAAWPTAPATALLVEALANARRDVAALQERGEPIGEWLTSQIRVRRIKEATAFVAALETVDRREDVAEMYRRLYPDRQDLLDRLLATLNWQPRRDHRQKPRPWKPSPGTETEGINWD